MSAYSASKNKIKGIKRRDKLDNYLLYKGC